MCRAQRRIYCNCDKRQFQKTGMRRIEMVLVNFRYLMGLILRTCLLRKTEDCCHVDSCNHDLPILGVKSISKFSNQEITN